MLHFDVRLHQLIKLKIITAKFDAEEAEFKKKWGLVKTPSQTLLYKPAIRILGLLHHSFEKHKSSGHPVSGLLRLNMPPLKKPDNARRRGVRHSFVPLKSHHFFR